MTNIWQPSGDPDLAERRTHYRQKLSSGRVDLGENNEGLVLNISQSGLALRMAQELVDDELPKIRFQLSESDAWIEAKGRVKWRNDAKTTAGVEFVDLSPATRKQIEILIFLSYETEYEHESKPADEVEPVEPEVVERESVETLPFPEEFEERSQESIISSSQPYSETEEYEIVPESAADADAGSEELIRQEQSELEFVSPPQISAKGQGLETNEYSAKAATEDVSSEAVNEEQTKAALLAEAKISVKRAIPPIVENAEPAKVSGSRYGRWVVVLCLAAGLVLLAFVPVRHYLQKTRTSETQKEVAEANLPVPAAAPVSSGGTTARPLAATVSRPEPSGGVSNVRTAPGHGAFGLQVGAMVQEENAKALAKSLKEIKVPVIIVKRPGDRFFRVLVGPYDGVETVARAKEEIEKRGFQAFRVKWAEENAGSRRIR
jgi:cell division septation protein DedD